MGWIAFEPVLPIWLLAGLAALAAAIAALGFLAGSKGALLRLVAFVFLLALLANPQRRATEETALDDIALIVVDESASQSLDGRARVAAEAAASLEERLAGLGGVEIVRTEVSGEEETRLTEGVATALADIPRGRLSGVFIVTDGQASDADTGALDLDAPVHAFLTGRADERDRKITLVNAPRYGIVREPVRIAFRVDDLGPEETPLENGPRSAQVSLRIDGRDVLSEQVPVGAEVAFNAPLDHPGGLIVELEVEPLAGELTTRNNVAILPVTAIRDRLRVLLISGEPHPGERVWRNLLKSDPAVDLVHFTILRPLDKGAPGELTSELALIPFPQDELFIDKLSEFDLVIFDRYTYRGVLQSYHFDNVARYVEEGGAVLVATGPEYEGPMSLAAQRNLSFVLPATPRGPAREGPFRPRLTSDGERHPVTAGLPEQEFWGRWLRIAPVALRSGRALMAGPGGAPLLILDRVGEGRVGLITSDHVWLWARGFDGGGPHAELLRRVSHWLMKEPELEEERLVLRGVGDTLRIERRSMENSPAPVEVTTPSGRELEIALAPAGPGRFAAAIENAERGLYRARTGDLFAVGAVGLAAAPEFQNVVATGSKVAPLAERTGGGVFSVRRGDGAAIPTIRRIGAGARAYAGDGWAAIAGRGAARIDSVRETPLAPAWVWLALVFAALLGAWAVEGRGARGLRQNVRRALTQPQAGRE